MNDVADMNFQVSPKLRWVRGPVPNSISLVSRISDT